MATLYVPARVQVVEIELRIDFCSSDVTNRKMTFTAKRNGAETVRQLADLLLSACDLASSKATPD